MPGNKSDQNEKIMQKFSSLLIDSGYFFNKFANKYLNKRITNFFIDIFEPITISHIKLFHF